VTDGIELRRQAATGIAFEAGALAMRYFTGVEALAVSMKGAQDWLTAADGAVETHIRKRLAEIFPDDAILGEEGGGSAADNIWIIDPIDGTANFAHQDRNWCVSIGFVQDGVPEIGVIYAPALGEMFVGRRGDGATLNGNPVKVAATNDISRACIELGWSSRRSYSDYFAIVEKLWTTGVHVRRSASGALGMVYVAAGRTDGYLELHINSWDVAAGYVIAREAGASLNDFFAGNAIMSGNPIVCLAPGVAGDLSDIAVAMLKT
jgi:myo-inositol-1(or 4)-monophosphatase